jgi:hypothetical protein
VKKLINMVHDIWLWWRINRHECDWCARSAVARMSIRSGGHIEKVYTCLRHVRNADIRIFDLSHNGDRDVDAQWSRRELRS